MKLKSTADGLKAVDVNNPDSTPLDLTTPMPGNTMFEGVEVWQGKDEKGLEWFVLDEKLVKLAHAVHGYDTRICYQPLEVKEQVREEFNDDAKLYPGTGIELVERHEVEASNPELGVETEQDWEQAAKRILTEQLGKPKFDEIFSFGLGVQWQKQATQQQGLVRLKEVESIVEAFRFEEANSDTRIAYNHALDNILTHLKTLK